MKPKIIFHAGFYKALLLTACVFMILFLGVIDGDIHPGIPFSVIFYLIPVWLVAWFIGLWPGILISLLAVAIRFYAETFPDITHLNIFVILWETGIRTVFFLIISILLSNMKKTINHEKNMARMDGLTGLANRRYFFEKAETEINRSRRYNKPFSVVYIDVDNFKKINDSFGHPVGDEVLKIIAKSIYQHVRITDISARLGGDEFAILLPESENNGARILLNKIFYLIKNSVSKFSFPVTFSVGVITYKKPPSSTDKMIKVADDLMYKIKRTTKNNIKYRTIR